MRKRILLPTICISLLAAGVLVAFSLIAASFLAVQPPLRPMVLIDAGHGGRDPGVVVAGIHESDVNLDIAIRVVELLSSEDSFDVVMTRNIDLYLSHDARIAIAEENEAGLYVSIQANACSYPEVTGIETWVDDDQNLGTESWKLAELIQGSLISGTGARDRGVRSMGLYLGRLSCPAILVEAGFLSSPEERAKLLSSEYQQTVAQCIVDGVLSMLR